MRDNYLTEIIVFSLFYLYLICQCVRSETLVTAKCSRPSVPSNAYIHSIPMENNNFDDKQKITIMCESHEDDGFLLTGHELECNKGRWKGKPPRCGQLKVK